MLVLVLVLVLAVLVALVVQLVLVVRLVQHSGAWDAEGEERVADTDRLKVLATLLLSR
jgi:uncharacterized protein HemY